MSDITIVDKMKLEKLFQMNSGYVLDLRNRTFQNFIKSSVGIDIYEEGKYVDSGTLKANRLRAFWDKEPNSIVGKLILDLLNSIKHCKRLFISDQELFDGML